MDRNEKGMWVVIVGLIFFWIIVLPAVIKGPKLFGAGPQPTSGDGGTGA
jgi:hypothetical protein